MLFGSSKKRILALLQSTHGQEFLGDEIRKICGVGRGAVYVHLHALEDEGKVCSREVTVPFKPDLAGLGCKRRSYWAPQARGDAHG